MANITHRQQLFVQKFVKHSSSMIQNGFAYLFSHRELIPMMDCEMKKIRSMERLQRCYPDRKVQYQQMLRQAYIEYIVKLTKFGFKYVKCNPEACNDIKHLEAIFDEYEILRNECREIKNSNKNQDQNRNQEKVNAPSTDNKFSQKLCDDQSWDETLKQINVLNYKIEELQGKVCDEPKPCEKTSDTLKKFNEYLEDKLKDINWKKKQRKRQRHLARAETKASSRSEVTQKLHEYCSEDQPEVIQKVINLEDSDNNDSEVMINVEEFSKSLSTKPQVGTIERNLIIPVKTSKHLMIVPRISFNKSSYDGSMELDLTLNFGNRVMHKNELVYDICIKNVMPSRRSTKKIFE